MNDPFASEILSITPVQPGFAVDVRHHETPQGGRPKLQEKLTFPVIAWALVKLTGWEDGAETPRVEPVFIPEDGRPIHATEYHRLYSDLRPVDGDPKLTVSVSIRAPKEDV